MLSRRRVLVIVMVFYGLIMISPVFAHIGVPGTFITLALFAMLFIVFGGIEIRIKRWFLYASMSVFLLAFVPTLFWMDERYVLASIFLIFSLFLVQMSDARVMDSFVTLATGLMLVLLLGAMVGFVLALNGAEPIFDVMNSDGRPNHFFYTTFSVMRWGNIIRPSGIYDEPGAFSFMICAVAALRHLRGRDARVTWLMLALGFVTLSLAHLVYVLLHAMAEKLRINNVAGIVAVLLPFLLVAAYLGGFDIVEKRLLSRATISASGEVAGDNRSWKMANAAAHLSDYPGSVLMGADPSCRFDKATCNEKFPFMGENPLSPLAIHGLFISWPYYLVLGVLFIAPLFGRKYVVSLAYGALLLQRPYMIGVGYSLMGLLVLATTVGSIVRDRHGEPMLAAAA